MLCLLFSTTGYIVLFLFLIYYFWFISESRFKQVPIILIFFISIFLFFNSSFLGEKISNQLSYSQGDVSYSDRSRFVSALVDLKDFLEDPIFGKGVNIETRYDEYNPYWSHRNNGVTDFAVKFGIVGFCIYFYSMFLSFRKYTSLNNFKSNYAYFFILVILLLGFSEVYFYRVFFISLSLLHLGLDDSEDL